jgi:4-methylaminobutanoate oxidase (formaldehyde-forming)
MRRNQPRDGSVIIDEVTSARACLGIWGPRSRDILQPLADTELSSEQFSYMTAKALTIGVVPCLALRVTYVGELGWELYCPTEYGLRLWDTVWQAGQRHGIVPGGYRAIESMRLEKGYRVWGSDITPEDNPYEAGLGFAVAANTSKDFIGKEALLRAKEAGIRRRLRALLLEDERAIAFGGEPVRAEGAPLGRVTSGGYGYTLGRSIAYAYVPSELAIGTRVEVEIFGRWVAATISKEPLYDPSGSRIRA